MEFRGTRPHPSWLLLFLALVLGAVAMLVLVLRMGTDLSQSQHDMAIGVAVLVLVLAALLQWLLIRQLAHTHDRAAAAESHAQQA